MCVFIYIRSALRNLIVAVHHHRRNLFTVTIDGRAIGRMAHVVPLQGSITAVQHSILTIPYRIVWLLRDVRSVFHIASSVPKDVWYRTKLLILCGLFGLCGATVPIYSQNTSILVYVQTNTRLAAIQENQLAVAAFGATDNSSTKTTSSTDASTANIAETGAASTTDFTNTSTANTNDDDRTNSTSTTNTISGTDISDAGTSNIHNSATIDNTDVNHNAIASRQRPLHQLVNEQKIEELRLTVEEGIMTSLFDRGYFVINSQPIGKGLSLNETTTSLWLRSLASDLGVNHLLFVDYRTYLADNRVIFDGGYQYIEIARPGNLRYNHIIQEGSGSSARKINRTAKNYGINIVNEILTN